MSINTGSHNTIKLRSYWYYCARVLKPYNVLSTSLMFAVHLLNKRTSLSGREITWINPHYCLITNKNYVRLKTNRNIYESKEENPVVLWALTFGAYLIICMLIMPRLWLRIHPSSVIINSENLSGRSTR